MIATLDLLGRAAPLPDVSESVRGFFRHDGGLARACRGGDFPYEERPQQVAMAEAVARALVAPCHLVAEAGTGVGKTFAYLAPLLLFGRQAGRKVAVATHTISLQEQLVHKDIPFLQEHLGVSFQAALCKGRGNYLCRRRLERADRLGGDLFQPGQASELQRLRDWAAATEDGSLSDLEPQPDSDLWAQV